MTRTTVNSQTIAERTIRWQWSLPVTLHRYADATCDCTSQLPADAAALLSVLGLRDGDTLVVRTATGGASLPSPQPAAAAATPVPAAQQGAAGGPASAAGAPKPAASSQKPPDAPRKPPAAVAGSERDAGAPAAASALPAMKSLQRTEATANGPAHATISQHPVRFVCNSCARTGRRCKPNVWSTSALWPFTRLQCPLRAYSLGRLPNPSCCCANIHPACTESAAVYRSRAVVIPAIAA